MLKLRKSEGFSLVELMIVVAIMAILAAIAIPTYLNFQMKARESEGRVNLAAVKTCEESYKAEHDEYMDCNVAPREDANLTALPEPWVDSAQGGFTAIGFNPSGSVRFNYLVEATGSTEFKGTANAALKGDGVDSTFTVSESDNVK